MKKTKTYTARCLAVLTAAVLLTGCGTGKTADYYNSPERGYTHLTIGDTIYRGGIGNIVQIHAGFTSPLEGLCRDPLCSHDMDTVCPDSAQFADTSRYYCTDGERIYFSVWNEYRSLEAVFETGVGKMIRQIYSIYPDGSDLTLLTEYEFTTISNEEMRIHDGYLYFEQSYYKENAPEQPSAEDQYTKIRRIFVNGGKTEDVFEEEFSVYVRFFVDDENYYLLEPDADTGRNVLTIINRDTRSEAKAEIPDNRSVISLYTYRDDTYILCAGDAVQVTYGEKHHFAPSIMFRFRDGAYDLIAEDIGSCTFAGGAFWYTPFEVQYHGTKEMPTGKANETEPMDFISKTGNTITRIDLETLTEEKWICDFGETASHIILGMSQGVLFAEISDMGRYFDTGVYETSIHKIKLNDDGTVTDLGEFKK